MGDAPGTLKLLVFIMCSLLDRVQKKERKQGADRGSLPNALQNYKTKNHQTCRCAVG
jgi:hypothetical protein